MANQEKVFVRKVLFEKYIDLRNLVYKYPTKHKIGFLPDELKDIVSKFPDINMEKYKNAMFGNTCAMIEKKLVMYHPDALTHPNSIVRAAARKVQGIKDG